MLLRKFALSFFNKKKLNLKYVALKQDEIINLQYCSYVLLTYKKKQLFIQSTFS